MNSKFQHQLNPFTCINNRLWTFLKIPIALFLVLLLPLQVWASNPKIERFSDHRNAAKISTALLEITHPLSGTVSAQGRSGEPVFLDVVLNPSDTDVKQILAGIKGVAVRHFSEKYLRVSLEIVDLKLLFTLANLPEVRSIRPEYGAIVHTGSVESLADRALGSDLLSANNALNGLGQTIGILSDSIAGGPNRDSDTTPAAGVAGTLRNSPAQDSGDLPAQITIFRDLAGRTDEGGAMAELVHDIAPAAAIAFNTAFVGEAGFADGIDQLCQSSTVVVDDVQFFAEPMYQAGIVAQAASDCVESGVPYFSSAGNSANFSVRSNYIDSNPANDNRAFPVNGEDLHSWNPNDQYLDIKLGPGASIFAVLQWNQPFDSISRGAGAEIDLDIYLTTTAAVPTFGGNLVALSFNPQGDTGAPRGDAVEILSFLNFSVSSRTVFLSLDHFQGLQNFIPQNNETPLEFRVVFFTRGQAEIEGITDRTSEFGASTMYGHSVAKGVVSVAAVPFFDTPAFGTNDHEFGSGTETAAIDPETFSARGGTLSIQFDRAGKFSRVTSFEPDITSVDGNNTSFFGVDQRFQSPELGEPDGLRNFFGTSAAAPNAAAVTALLQQWMPPQKNTRSRNNNSSLNPSQITAILQNTAIDVTGFRAAKGIDDVSGHGLIDAPAALRRAINRAPGFQANPETITVCTNAGGQAFPGWATGLFDSDFETQQLDFLVENDNPELFGGLLGLGGQPGISIPSGSLYFRGSLNASGSATVTVRIQDDGGTAHGGQDTSPSKSFRIIVDPNCDDGAGEIFNPGSLGFDFSSNLSVGAGTDLSLIIERQLSLDQSIAAAANVPLNGLDAAIQSSFLTGVDKAPLIVSDLTEVDSFSATIINFGPSIAEQVQIWLALSNYAAITEIDPRCAGDLLTGNFICKLERVQVGRTSLNFKILKKRDQPLEVTGELASASDVEFRDNRAVLEPELAVKPVNVAKPGGGALLWWNLVVLAGLFYLSGRSPRCSSRSGDLEN